MSVTKPYQALYEKTKNPIHVFEAYRTARIGKVETPDWVLDHFDAWAHILCVERPRTAMGIARALGLSKGGGGPSQTSQFETQIRNLSIVQRIDTLRKVRGLTLDEAIETLTDKYCLTHEAVRDIWYDLTRDPSK